MSETSSAATNAALATLRQNIKSRRAAVNKKKKCAGIRASIDLIECDTGGRNQCSAKITSDLNQIPFKMAI